MNTQYTIHEKIDLLLLAYSKMQYDLILYWHYQSFKNDLLEEIKEGYNLKQI